MGTAPDPNNPNDPNAVAVIVEDPERGQVMQINGRGLQVDGPFDIRTSVSLTFWTKIDLPREGRFFSGGPWQFRTDNQSSSAHDWIEIFMVFDQPVQTIFLIERNGNDKGFLQALDADGVPFGALTHFATSDWLKTEYTINGSQVASGVRLIANLPIYGVRVTPDGTMGLDPVSVSGIPSDIPVVE